MSNKDTLALLHNVSWSITDPIDKAGIYEGDSMDPRPLTEKEWGMIVSTEKMKLFLPTDDWQSNERYVFLPANSTVKDVLGRISDFYHTPRNVHEFEVMLRNDETDEWDADVIRNFISEIKNEGKKYTFGDLMTDHIFFEGIEPEEGNKWRMLLGS